MNSLTRCGAILMLWAASLGASLIPTSLTAQDLEVSQVTTVRCAVDADAYQWVVTGPRGYVEFIQDGRTITFSSTQEWRIVVCTPKGSPQITTEINGGKPVNPPEGPDGPEVPPPAAEPVNLYILTDPALSVPTEAIAIQQIQDHYARGPPEVSVLPKGVKDQRGEPLQLRADLEKQIPEGETVPYYFEVDGDGKVIRHGHIDSAKDVTGVDPPSEGGSNNAGKS